MSEYYFSDKDIMSYQQYSPETYQATLLHVHMLPFDVMSVSEINNGKTVHGGVNVIFEECSSTVTVDSF